ncbi:alanine--tRNA ligase [Candidatus Bipolaricaulota bacterium]|nr:alanine--tRNA ligase [Candidatus Bipolaricaulota bacterium]
MKANELRHQYLGFFEERGHERIPSSSLVPNDPTLLFTAAGMVQFKDLFWGRGTVSFSRAVTCQKCFRTTDIENVGRTAYHHTFFEMLGNFSFGAYFKEGAIDLAWEFLTKELMIPTERLSVSVYEEDNEAYEIWNDRIGIPAQRISRLGKRHNWWGPVGDGGPCGPDSEIFFDGGEDRACGPDCRGVACDCDRFSEIWNLVFMQYDAQADGTLLPLSRKNIDTGMGLERTSAVLQGVSTNFEIDSFRGLLEAIEAATPRGLQDRIAVQHRNTVADHVRGVLFLVADGVLPGNEGRGYVARRILRRAVRAGEHLELPEGTLARLVEPIVAAMGPSYPEIVQASEVAERVIGREESVFRRTLREGERRLEKLIATQVDDDEKRRVLPGGAVFELHDTYGFPVEMVREIAADAGFSLDDVGYREALARQRDRSRRDTKRSHHEASRNAAESDGVAGEGWHERTTFVGYEKLATESEILWTHPEGEHLRIVFEETPFYAESGGQVSDQGEVRTVAGSATGCVLGVRKNASGAFEHLVLVEKGRFSVGDRCILRVNRERRRRIERNHTATHLLHQALRQVVGEHVVQAGSVVGAEELRFDFSHFEPLSSEQIAQVEDEVNAAIWADHAVETLELSLEDALASGAMAHFAEEYRGKDRVRVLSVGDYSKELCGGTHVRRSGEIGMVLITGEESVAAGTRRIRAVTSSGVVSVQRSRFQRLADLEASLGEDPLESVARLRADRRALTEQVARLNEMFLLQETEKMADRAERRSGRAVLIDRVDRSAEELKRMADLLEERLRPAIVVLVGVVGDRGVVVCKKSAGIDGFHAGNLIRSLSKMLGGGGGGNDLFGQGGGGNISAIDEIVAAATETLRGLET